MMIQFQAGLHAIKGLKFDEPKTAAFVALLFVGCDAHGYGGNFGEVFCYGVVCCGVGEVSYICQLAVGLLWG